MLSILHSAFLVFVLSSFVAAQIDAGAIPQACQSPCKKLLDLENTCVVEYPQQGTKPTATACFCNALVGLDYSSCTTCLNSNSPTLAQSVSQLSGFCTQFIDGCVYKCSFDTCPSSNVQCQCKETYLQDIYDCAFCNSGHGNTNVTTLSDYTALSDSCSNQGQTATPTGTDPVPTPSGTIPYTGGGISLASFSSGSYSTHASAGTTSHASASTTATTSGTTTGTGGTNTGTVSTTVTSLTATPSSLTGGSAKIKSSLKIDGWISLIAFGSMLTALGELV